jgi:hypothetical protein
MLILSLKQEWLGNIRGDKNQEAEGQVFFNTIIDRFGAHDKPAEIEKVMGGH